MLSAIAEQREEQAISIPSNVLDRVGGRVAKMQMLPAIAQQALEMVRDPDCTIKGFARLIEQDLKLATEMLRMANSAIYSQGRTIASLSEAAVRLGMSQCKNLILTSSFASLIEGLNLEEEWVRELLWRHGLVTAVIATNLNKKFKLGLNGEEFTAGLVHDVGRILLAVSMPENFLEGDPVDFQEPIGVRLRQEQQTWGTTHTEVGAWFAVQNRLPACLVSAIRYHHFPNRAPSDKRLVAVIAVADDMANYVQRHQSADGYDPNSNPFIDQLADAGVDRARATLESSSREILEKSCQDALDLCGMK